MASFLKKHWGHYAVVSSIGMIIVVITNIPKPSTLEVKGSNDILKVVIAGSPHESDHLPFDWKTYDDPSRPEFWADGDDGIMPRPFLHLAGEPTIENAKQLLAWKKKQWAVVKEVITALGGASELQLYSKIIGKDFIEFAAEMDPMYQLASARVNENEPKSDEVDWSSLQIVYVYRSTCEHCKSDVPLIDGLKTLGAKVAPLQIDFKDQKSLHSNSKAYTKDLEQFFPLENGEPTPTFFFRYKDQKPFTHVGSLSLSYLSNHLINPEEKI